MTTPDRTSLEARLSNVLEEEAGVVMTLTDTPRQLELFQANTRRRRNRSRVISVAAAVLCLVAGAAIVAKVIGVGGSGSAVPAGHPTAGSHQHSQPLTIGPPQLLPVTVPITTVKGPQWLGVSAFGAIWATAASGNVDQYGVTLYRISADGSRVLGTASYPRLDYNESDPVRIGDAIVVADRAGKYIAFSPAGKKVATFPNATLGASAGNASGGWIATKPDQVAHIDATGRRIDRTLTLPVHDIVGLAISPGTLWVIDKQAEQLDRVDISTGKITGRRTLSVPPLQVAYVDGAVYLVDFIGFDGYGVQRIDPTSMRVTATALGLYGEAPIIADAPPGQLWVQSSGGTVAQLDPVSLRTERSVQLFPGPDTDESGALVTGSRVFVASPIQNELYSYPLP